MTTPADKANERYFTVPKKLIGWQPPTETGIELSPGDKFIWGLIDDYPRDPASHRRAPTLADLARLLGSKTKKPVRNSLRKLERAGLIGVRRAPEPLRGRRDERASRYFTIRPNVPVWAPLGNGQQYPDGRVNVPKRDLQRSPDGHVNGTVWEPPIRETETSRQQTGAAAKRAEVARLLAAEGIDRERANAEAARPEITRSVVNAVAAEATRKGRPPGDARRPGLILTMLAEGSPELKQCTRDAEQQAAKARAQQAEADRSRQMHAKIVAAPADIRAKAEAAVCRRVQSTPAGAGFHRPKPERDFELAGGDLTLLDPSYVALLGDELDKIQRQGATA